jgi:hypothetical protein
VSPATVQELLELASSPARLRELGCGLDPLLPDGVEQVSPSAWTLDVPAFQREGLGAVEGVVSAQTAERLVGAMTAFEQRALPATFVYAFPEPWAIGERVRSRLEQLVGYELSLVEDVWAFLVPRGSSGWRPHRGIGDTLLDRDAPEILNVWVALTEVTVDRACMHALPLDRDPGYPRALDAREAPAEWVRALPVAQGDALFWNANVLHWGGACAESAAGARASCTFTLCRADKAHLFPSLKLLPRTVALDLAARIDAVARMVRIYGGSDLGDVTATVREWAAITSALADRFSGRKAP